MYESIHMNRTKLKIIIGFGIDNRPYRRILEETGVDRDGWLNYRSFYSTVGDLEGTRDRWIELS